MNKSNSFLNNIGSFFLHGNIKTCYQEDRKSPNFISTTVIYMYKTPVNIQCVNVLTFLCMGGRYHTSATNAQLVSRSKMCWTIPILLLFQKASPYRLSYYKQNRKRFVIIIKELHNIQNREQLAYSYSLTEANYNIWMLNSHRHKFNAFT